MSVEENGLTFEWRAFWVRSFARGCTERRVAKRQIFEKEDGKL